MVDVVVEVRLAVGADDAALLAVVEALERAGAADLELAEQARPPRAWARFVDLSIEGARRRVQDGLQSASIVEQIRAAALTTQDWNSVAAFGLRAARFGSLTVVPPGLPAEGDAVLEIDAGGAFGSGLHPSTALVLEWLASEPPPEVVLDFGTGTGILGLAALRLGAARAVGLDVDPTALRVAAANAAANGLEGRFEVHAGPLEALERQFPLVLANVLAAPLAALAPRLVRAIAPGATLVLSGLQPHQVEDVVRAYRDLGMWWTGQSERDGWVSLRLRPSW